MSVNQKNARMPAATKRKIAFRNCPVYNCPRPGIKKDSINARRGDAICYRIAFLIYKYTGLWALSDFSVIGEYEIDCLSSNQLKK
jgi:hypothetical protein